MGQILNSGEVGNIGLRQLKEQRELISQKWAKLGLLDGLKGHIKDNIAQLYENQASYMLNESTTASDSGSFETVAFPIIRRVFSKLLANDIVSVQALNLPIGKLFYLNPKVSTRVDTGSTGHTSPDGAYSNAADLAAGSGTQFETKSLYDSFYAEKNNDEGTSLFDRSKGAFTSTDAVLTGATPQSGVTSFRTFQLTGFTTTSDGKLVGPAGVPMDTEEFLASLKVTADQSLSGGSGFQGASITAGDPVPFRVKTQQYGREIVSSKGIIDIEVDLSYPAKDGYSAFTSYVDGTAVNKILFTANYRTYSDLEQDSEMAEVTFTLDEVTVSVTTRKMRAQWTPELAQDVSAFHNIDAEAELTALLSEQMAAEVDREILRDLRRGAAWSLRWDYNGLRNQTTQYHGTQKDWNQTLITKVNQISAQIHKATLRGGASWIVVSPEISAVLDDLEYFHVSNADPEQDKYNMGIERIGSLGGRYQVYRDPYAPANTMLIGHKGNSILEAGYIYAPYVPMQLTPTMFNPFDFKPIKGIMSRYAKKLINNRFYGKVYCDGLVTFDPSELR